MEKAFLTSRAWAGRFYWSLLHLLSCILGEGEKEDILDLKVENAPCCFQSASRFLSLSSISIIPTLISLVTDASQLNAFNLFIEAYLLFYLHFLVRSRSTVIKSPPLPWRPLLINLSVCYPLFN